MVLGGIPVSGGITGKGTLISTNLLYSPLLYDSYGNPLPRPAYTLGGDAGVAGYEAAYAIDQYPKTIWKPAATTDDQNFTMIHGANPPTVYGVVLLGHNITAAGVSLAKFEGGMDTNYDTVSEDLVINAAALTPVYHLLASPQAYDHWRVRVNFVASTALQLGEVFLIGTAPIPFDVNYQWHAPSNMEKGQVISKGISGVPRSYTRWRSFYKSISFISITTAQLDALKAADLNAHVIFSPDGANGRAYFGLLTLEPETEEYGKWNVKAKFSECAV